MALASKTTTRSRNLKFSVFIAVFSLTPFIGSQAYSAQNSVYVIERLTTNLLAENPIGSKRAGLVCLPNGTLRWRDLNAGSDEVLRENFIRRLRDLKVDATDVGVNGYGVHLTGRLLDLSVKACARKWGLGQKRALTGSGVIEFEWIRSVDGTSHSFSTRSEFSFDPDRSANAPIVDAALQAVAQSLVAKLSEPLP